MDLISINREATTHSDANGSAICVKTHDMSFFVLNDIEQAIRGGGYI